MGDEAVNGVNTGVCGGFTGVLWTVETGGGGTGDGGVADGGGMAWESRWKMTEKEALAEADTSFFVCCGKGGKRDDFVVISKMGLLLGLHNGVTFAMEWGYKMWNWGGGWKGGKSTHFLSLPPDFGQ